MRIGILTSTETRHRFFANAMSAWFPVAAVCYEEVAYKQATIDTGDLSRDEAAIVRDHFAERTRQEEIFFGHDAECVRNAIDHGSRESTIYRNFSGPACGARQFSDNQIVQVLDSPNRPCPAARKIPPGELNAAATLDFLLSHEVDTVVVFGTDLIKPPLLGRWPGRMINMHLGLSPYYRGTATNFYPLLNLEPQYIGATIHQIDAGIDSGPILQHARPQLLPDDPPHVIGCKAILAGIDAMANVLRGFAAGGRLEGVSQWTVPNPRLYLRRDYHQRQVVELYGKIADGLLRDAIHRANAAPPPRLVQPSGNTTGASHGSPGASPSEGSNRIGDSP